VVISSLKSEIASLEKDTRIKPSRFFQFHQKLEKDPIIQWGSTIVIMAIAFVVRMGIPLPYQAAPYATFSIAIIAISLLIGTVHALLSLGLSIVLVWGFFVPPIGDQVVLIRTTLFLVNSLVNIVSLHIMWAAVKRMQYIFNNLVERDLRIKELLGEVSHRVKNQLAVITGIARHTHSDSIEEYQKSFIYRLHALSDIHDLLVEKQWEDPSLEEVILLHIKPFGLNRFVVSGGKVQFKVRSVHYLSMALHELGTNAIKYGALSKPNGKVHIKWYIKDNEIYFSWVEEGGPLVDHPTRNGFGSSVIERFAPTALEARYSQISYNPEGVTWEMIIPLDKILYLR
jgi:two-component sensor histidine kinase